MRRKTAFGGLLVVLVALAVALVAGITAGSSQAAPQKGKTITIWDYFINSQKERTALNAVAQQWAKKTGNRVVNAGDIAESKNKFKLSARTGRGPDVIQLPHDNLGDIAAPGLLAAQPKGFQVSRGLYDKVGLTAVTYKGQLYGLPIGRESYFLFYNKAMVSSPPKTWNALITTAKRLTSGDKYGFLWDTSNFYYAYSWIRGYGGYVFKVTKNGYDQTKLGINTPGGIKALKFIQDLVQVHHLTPASTNTDIMEGNFKNGKAAMIIDGPWATQNFKSAGVNFGVAALPKLPNGHPSSPFVGLQALFVNKYSKNTKEAWDLVRYLSIHLPMPLFKASGRVPVLKSAASSKLVQSSPVTKVVIQAANNGEPMPNIPAMNLVWEPMGDQLTLLVQGKTTPAAAARTAQERIAKAIKEQSGG
jgi:arabinogalactan oligomer / maltooligosaccharide transport system substrate-binding protein